METFTLGTAIGLNMTHNAAAWNRARLVEAKGRYVFSWRGRAGEFWYFFPKESVGPPSRFD